MRTSLNRRDYCSYQFSGGEGLLVLGGILGGILLTAWTFYDSLWAVPALCVPGYLLLRYIRRQKLEGRRRELTVEFKECILSVSASLQAGYAVENAFLESREDMRNLFGEESMIYEELEVLRRGLIINITLEEQLADLGERSGIEEIRQFAGMLAIAKRGGGNLPEMIRTSAELISQKVETRQEIDVVLAGKKMEQNMMRLMPFGIVWYVGSTNPGYFQPMYHNPEGVCIMSLCLAVYFGALALGEKVFGRIERELSGKLPDVKLPGLAGMGEEGRLLRLGSAVYRLVDKRFPRRPGKLRVRRYLELLCPEEEKEALLERYFGGKLGMSLLVLGAGGLLGMLAFLKKRGEGGGELCLLLWGLSAVTGVLIYFLLDKDLEKQVEKRRSLLRLGYPELLHHLALYLVSGLPIRSAFGRLGEDYELARIAYRELQTGCSEAVAYEHFGKRAGLPEYVKLGALLSQNIKKGSGNLIARLKEEAGDMMERRIQNGKRLGEEAAAKLLIPMVMILAVVMVMIMVPAFSMMGI